MTPIKILTKTSQATKKKAKAMETSQTTSQLSSEETSAEEVAMEKTVAATEEVAELSTTSTTIKARDLAMTKSLGKTDHLTTTIMAIANSEGEGTMTTLKVATGTNITRTLTNATILTTSATTGLVTAKMVRTPLTSSAVKNPTVHLSEGETAVQSAGACECAVEASEVTIEEAKACVEVPSGEVKAIPTMELTKVHTVEAMLQTEEIEECGEVYKDTFHRTYTREVMEEKSPNRKTLTLTTNIEKRP